MRPLRSMRIARMSAFILFAAVISAGAAEKPAVTRVDANYLDQSVVFAVEWQSPNPVSLIRVYIGKKKKEVKIDEYDNRRNQAGYWGEKNIEFNLAPEHHQDFIPYILQIEDELRQKSDQVTGKVMFPVHGMKEADDGWGRTHLDKFSNPPPLGSPQTSSTPYSPVDPVTGQPQVTAGSYPPGGYPADSYPPPVVAPPIVVPGGTSPTGGMPFFIETIRHEKLGDMVNVKVTVVDQIGVGVDCIILVVYDANQNPIPNQPDIIRQVAPVGGKYEGMASLQLPNGRYSIKGQALNKNGELSPEKASDELRIGEP